MSLHLDNRRQKLGVFAVAGVAVALLTGCAVDSEALLLDTVTAVSQSVLNALLDALSSYLASS